MQFANSLWHAANFAALRSQEKFRRIKMQIKSLVSIVSGLETAKSRRMALKKSWSAQDKEERRRLAVNAQLQLASLMGLLDANGRRAKDLEQLAACG